MKGKVLVIYHHDLGFPLRKTVEDSLTCFEKYTSLNCFYLNVAFGVPDYAIKVNYDLVIYHNIFLSKRSLPRRFNKVLKQSEILKRVSGYKIAFPQDEYEFTNSLNKFIVDFNIDHVFSITPESQIPVIYHSIDRNKIKINRVLTGYLDRSTVSEITEHLKTVRNRSIDIGYRANKLSYSLGKHAYLKYYIGEMFMDKCRGLSLKKDISNNPKDTFLGFSWYKFLCDCKYTLGVEGGASIHDPDGKIADEVKAYINSHPKASFEEVHSNLLERYEGNLKHQVLSPRILECCVTKTCQVLIEGEYNGILKPNIHYIELKKDFSNLHDVIEHISSDILRSEITERAYNDVMMNEKLYYDNYVKDLIRVSLGKRYVFKKISEIDLEISKKLKRRETFLWGYVIPTRSFIVSSILNNIPVSMFNVIEKFYKKG